MAQFGRDSDHRGRTLDPRRDPRRVHDRQTDRCATGRLRGRCGQRRHLAGARLPDRAVVSPDPGPRRDRPQCCVRRLGAGAAARRRDRQFLDVAVDRRRPCHRHHVDHDDAGTRRQHLLRSARVAPGAPALEECQRDRRARRRFRAVRRRRARGSAASDPVGGRADVAPMAARWKPPPGRMGDRVVVADRCQPGRDPARLDGRHARVPVARQGHRRDRRVESSEVRGGDRTRPLRWQRPARSSGFELRQPVLGRRRARRVDDERRRSSQGGSYGCRLLRILLAAGSGHANDDRARSPRSAGSGLRRRDSDGAMSSRASIGTGRMPCSAPSRRW